METPKKSAMIVNLFAGPGAGKSTGAAYIFSMLKMRGIDCELITEFAKDKTWEKNFVSLSHQGYVFGKQSYKIARCADQVDVIVTDSPLLLSIHYAKSDPTCTENFDKWVVDVFNSYNNYNYMVKRVKPYNPNGRNQTSTEADIITMEVENILISNDIPFARIDGDRDGYDRVVEDICQLLGK